MKKVEQIEGATSLMKYKEEFETVYSLIIAHNMLSMNDSAIVPIESAQIPFVNIRKVKTINVANN